MSKYKYGVWGLALHLLMVVVAACSGTTEADITDGNDAKTAKLKLPPGFHAEHLYSPFDNGNGSWVSMVFDDQQRLIASDQYGKLYRLELPPIGEKDIPAKVKVEPLPFDPPVDKGSNDLQQKIVLGYAQGLVWAFNSLYVVVNHLGDSLFEKGSGLYRIWDTDGNGRFDAIAQIKSMTGYEEHGPHSIVLAPDKQSFYIIAGNFTGLPKDVDRYRIPRARHRDNLMPDRSNKDGRVQEAAGWIAKVDSSGAHWELVAAGLRNPFDIAFNEAGEMFTYDSDMEWDIGMPWYRPTRICHVTSGAEFGWRDGNAKFSPAYPDNLPPILNIGQGSPTNLVSAHTSAFPARYRQSLLAFDWSFGIIYAVHLTEQGASYAAEAEEFISGAPLPLTDGVIGPDGALYFLTGGRRLESDLYRVYYKGDPAEELANSPHTAPDPGELIQLRRRLEQLHMPSDADAVNIAWPYLRHPDRFIRYAARTVLEHQPVERWQARVFKERDTRALIEASIALAKSGTPSVRNRLLETLMGQDYSRLSPEVQGYLLRAIELSLLRLGQPDKTLRGRLIGYLDPHYPASSDQLNRGLSKILASLEAPGVVSKTLALLESAKDQPDTADATVARMSDLIFRNPQYGMDLAEVLSNTPPAQQIFYAMVLSGVRTGWTPDLYEKYFRWFYNAYAFKGGRHYIGYINKARTAALEFAPAARAAYYDSISLNTASLNAVTDWVKIMSDGGAGRNWKIAEALEMWEEGAGKRDFERGKMAYAASACIACHTMRGEGGAVGPDLTQLGTRFSVRDMLESIIDPNKTISDQYAATTFYLKDGSTVTGRLMNEDDNMYSISQNPFAPDKLRQIPKKEVDQTKLSGVSSMPPGLINSLDPERMKDLLAYLVAGGNKEHPVYTSGK